MLHRKLAIVLMMPLALCRFTATAQGQVIGNMQELAPLSAAENAMPSHEYAGSSSSSSAITLTPREHTRDRVEERHMRPFSTIALGLKVNSLGAGVEIATPLAKRVNLRTTVNVIDYGYKFDSDGTHYNAEIHFHSAQMSADWFPFHGEFHISPGIMVFNNKIAAQIVVPPGQTFDLEGFDLTSSQSNPISGGATALYGKKIAPMVTAGFGNILPRNGRHLTVPFEIGGAFLGTPQVNIGLGGTACMSDGCFSVATNQETQTDLKQKQNDINTELKKFQIYPVISMGVAYRF